MTLSILNISYSIWLLYYIYSNRNFFPLLSLCLACVMVVCNMWLQVHFQCGFIFTEVLCKLDMLSPPRENLFLICKKSQGYHCIKTHFLCWCLGLAFQDPEVTVNSSSLTSKMISLVWFFFSLTQITSTLKKLPLYLPPFFALFSDAINQFCRLPFSFAGRFYVGIF